jgi:hypothetical protein
MQMKAEFQKDEISEHLLCQDQYQYGEHDEASTKDAIYDLEHVESKLIHQIK